MGNPRPAARVQAPAGAGELQGLAQPAAGCLQHLLETRETWWHLPSGQTLRVIAELHPFGGVTYLYDDVTEQIRLESQYRELIGVQRETVDNLHEGVALFGTDGKLKLFNPTFSRVWGSTPRRLPRSRTSAR